MSICGLGKIPLGLWSRQAEIDFSRIGIAITTLITTTQPKTELHRRSTFIFRRI